MSTLGHDSHRVQVSSVLLIGLVVVTETLGEQEGQAFTSFSKEKVSETSITLTCFRYTLFHMQLE